MNETFNKLKTSIFVSFLFSFTLLFFGPSIIIISNSPEFSYTYYDILPYLIIIPLLLSLIISVLVCFLKKPVYEKIVLIIFAVGVLVWIQGNILVWNYGVFDGRSIDWSRHRFEEIIDILIWIGLIILVIKYSKFILSIIKQISIVLIIVQIVTLVPFFIGKPLVSQTNHYVIKEDKKFDFSKDKNIIVFLLDSFQTDVFNEIINEDNKYKEMFQGFTYFRNSLGGYPFTDISIPLILTGEYYENKTPYDKWLRDVYTNSSITNTLHKEGFDVEIYLNSSKSVYIDENILANFEKTKLNINQFAEVYDVALFRYLPTPLKKLIYNNQEWFLQKNVKVDESKKYEVKSKTLDAKNVKRSVILQFIDSFLYYTNSNNTKNTFKFYYLCFPHWPLTLNENFEHGDMEINRDNYKRSCKAALKILDLAMKKLQEEEIYDNTMILVLGDHGAGFQGQEFILQDGMPANKNTDTVTDNYRITALPLVLIKPFNTNERLKISDAPVSLMDVPKTIITELGIEANFPGISMFEIDESVQRERRFMRYSSIEPPYYGDMYEYIVSGYGWLNESWEPTYRKYTSKGIIENKPTNIEIGQTLTFGKDGNVLPYLKNGWSNPENIITWTLGDKASLYIPLYTNDDIIMEIDALPYLASGKIREQKVNVVVNGEKITELRYSKNSNNEKYVFIPGELIKDSDFTIDFEFQNAASPFEMKESDDARKLALAFKSIAFNKITKYAFGDDITFGKDGNYSGYQPNGWYSPGDGHNWSMEKASLTIPIDETESDLMLTINFINFLHEGKSVNIFVNGQKVGDWSFDNQNTEQASILINNNLLKDDKLEVMFEVIGAKSPKEIGYNDDERVLGVCLKSIVVQETDK